MNKVEGGTKVIILVGGPTRGTRFRPLSLEIPKPLFPIAGHPLIWHHIKACTKLQDLFEIYLVGFYDFSTPEWQNFINKTQKELNVCIKFLQEKKRLGTAGGIKKFKNEILSGNPNSFFVLHCDICCSFPLNEIQIFHKKHQKECTILGKKVNPDEAKKYGCLAVDPNSNEVLHYVEKPETFISNIINCGVYLFSPSFFQLIDNYSNAKCDPDVDPNFLRLEQDVLMKICGENHVYVYETKEFWFQLKSAGMIIKCAENLLSFQRNEEDSILAKSGDGITSPQIIGDVLIHPTAKVDPTAKIGPNVSIGANVIIRAGTRILHSIILDGAEIKSRACVLHTIVGWNSIIGEWSRLEGIPDFSPTADARSCGITILGTGVYVAPEIVIRSSIVLPHKDIFHNINNQILL
jgi:mannose-1-phosphate guanylyltransferase